MSRQSAPCQHAPSKRQPARSRTPCTASVNGEAPPMCASSKRGSRDGCGTDEPEPPREHRLRTRRRGCRGIETPASADLGTSGTNADRLPGVTAIRTVPTRAVEAPAGALEDTVRGISERRRATHVRFEQTRQPGRMRNRGKQSPRTRWTTSLSRDDTPPANPATERPKAQPVAHLAATRSKTSRKHPRTPPKNPATRRSHAQPAAHPGSTPTAVRHDRATPTSATTEPPAQQEKPR